MQPTMSDRLALLLLLPLACGDAASLLTDASGTTGTSEPGSSTAATAAPTTTTTPPTSEPAPTTTPGEGSASDSASTGSPEPDAPTPVQGYADLHLHMMAEEAFGGGWFHGAHAGVEAVALAMCDGGFPGDHARLRSDLSEQFDLCQDEDLPLDLGTLAGMVPILDALLFLGGVPTSELIGTIEGTDGDTGLHQHRKAGAPDFSGWPRWDTIAHQQSHAAWLKRAHDDGLRLVVMSAVSFDWLCTALPPGNLERPQCDEMDDVRVQLERAHALDAAHDWLEIALSAAHARQIASEGRLAMILGIEASSIFGAGDWLTELDEVHALGVRTLQLVHQLDNRFGGAAPHNAIFQVAQFTRNCHVDSDCGLTTPALTLGFDVDADCKNVQGLTAEGAALIDEMMTRGMLIDAAHMSERTFADVYALAEANDYYPLYVSHGHFREIMTPAKQREEKTSPADLVAALRRTGGVFGLRTAHEEVNAYPAGGVANDCHGSSRSLAQAYQFGRLGLKVDLALGTDFNGFIQQTRPRFGQDGACSASFADEAECQRRGQLGAGPPPLGSDLDTRGFAHIGLLGDLILELDQLGVDTGALNDSAERVLRMWERAEGPRRGPATTADDLDPGGVEVSPTIDERKAAFPKECGVAYCAASLAPGDACAFDGECTSNNCSAGPCGVPKGTCK